MEIKVENTPSIDRKSWIGVIVDVTGTKTWCSLAIRGTTLATFVLLYITGLIHFYTHVDPSFEGFWENAWMLGVMMTTIVLGLASVIGAILGIGTLNEWAQTKCTPIFEEKD